ncbi:MAG: D-sedoheptulose 7-phosphate isomerase [Planctomycetes bacterium]|nr:D-sedoheptulose 7-phosphate isomerase [Planctomycetota bacterium]
MIEAIRAHLQMGAGVYTHMADDMAEPIARAAEMLIEALRAGRRVYVCGNGGSAAQAQHIAGELIGRFLKDRGPLPCVALTTDTSVLTAVANDYEFETVFARQVDALVGEGDVLWLLSTSGTSVNVLKAASCANRRGAKLLGMTGRSGGKLKELCDVTLRVPADSSPPVQEGHLALIHILCGLVEQALFPENEAAP